MIAHGGSYEGKIYNIKKDEKCNGEGKFSQDITTPSLPSGKYGTAEIKAIGRTSQKQATTTINVT